MKRLGVLVAAGAIALAACGKKKDEGDKAGGDSGTGKAPAAEVKHGEKGGKGTGGGEKTAAGSKDGKAGSAKPGDAKLVERGAYLASLGGCILCHTPMGPQGPDMSKAFAGGMEMTEEFGTWRSLNITPDPETGIGKWTDEQILAAIRDGVRPDGSKLSPMAMPWMFYGAMTDADGKAIVAFLRSVKPVVNKVERAELPPMDLPAPPHQRVDPDDPVGHGAYLASIMHCMACHTPMTEKGPDMAKAFAGGLKMMMPPQLATGDVYSSNLTPDEETGLGKWSEDDIVKTLKTMVRPDGRPILGPMMFYAPVWSQLHDDDAAAIAKFLKSLPPVKNEIPASTMKMNAPPH